MSARTPQPAQFRTAAGVRNLGHAAQSHPLEAIATLGPHTNATFYREVDPLTGRVGTRVNVPISDARGNRRYTDTLVSEELLVQAALLQQRIDGAGRTPPSRQRRVR